MIPEGLKDEHFKQAATEIDRDGVPRQRKSRYYDLVLNGRNYPPKYIISLATRLAIGKELSSEDFNAVEAKNYFENRGLKIIDRRIKIVQDTLIRLLPDKKLRENCLNVFSECIICADESGSNKWGVHLQKNRIRLIVGSMIVCTIQDEEIWIALDGEKLESYSKFEDVLNNSPNWRWDTEDYPEYTRVPSRNGYYRPNDRNLEFWSTIKELHYKFIRNVGNKFESLQNRSQAKHEPELLNIIQNLTGKSLPVPEHNSFDENALLEKHIKELEKLDIPETEKDAIIKSRIGQSKFRTSLKIHWNNRCTVTGCSFVELLIASHIKPWSDSNNHERLDEFNGFLLTPNLDKAFDSGLISFKKDGSILISNEINDEQITALGIDEGMELRHVDENHHKYLEFHRNHIFNSK